MAEANSSSKTNAELKDDMTKLRSDLSKLAQDVQSLTSERGRHAYEAARERGSQAREYATTTVETHPLASVLTAFGAGLLIGKLLGRN